MNRGKTPPPLAPPPWSPYTTAPVTRAVRTIQSRTAPWVWVATMAVGLAYGGIRLGFFLNDLVRRMDRVEEVERAIATKLGVSLLDGDGDAP